MTNIIDRRVSPNKRYSRSRERFMERNREKIKEAIDKQISDSTIKDIGKGGVDVTVPKRGISEPFIHHGQGGVNEKVLPGNKEFNGGERLPKPKGGAGGKGNKKGEPGDGDGEDDFVFNLSEEEFLNYLYEDLALPNLVKKSALDASMTKPKRSGIVSEGPFHKLELGRSQQARLGRMVALNKPINKRILEALKSQYGILLTHAADRESATRAFWEKAQNARPLKDSIAAYKEAVTTLKDEYLETLDAAERETIESLDKQIKEQEHRRSLIPKWNESTDLRFRQHVQVPQPATRAVMFCLMDVSGSMSQEKKDNAKLFYMLLYKFLQRNYETVDIVFVRHTTEAEEVDEQTFFYDQKSGGTRVSTVLQKMDDILEERYPTSEWNIYGAQSSDGENIGNDNAECVRLLHVLLKKSQGFFYTEVSDSMGRFGDDLWPDYEPLKDAYTGRFFMGRIEGRKDIWPVFREFFQQREEYGTGVINAAAYAPAL